MTNPFSTDAFRVVYRFSALASVVYGLYILVFGFSGYSAFSSYSDVPAWAFGSPLIVGGGVQFTACCYYNRWWSVGGTALCAAIFLAAELSCFSSHPSTGIPAYFWIAVAEFVMIYCVLRKPLPCPSKS